MNGKVSDDKQHITVTLGVSGVGESLPMQVIYRRKMKQGLSKFNFPKSFSVLFSENHCSNSSKSVTFFMDIIFLYLQIVKKEKCIPKDQYSLVIMDRFKGQDNDLLKKLCDKNFCKVVIVLHNLTSSLQIYPLVSRLKHLFITRATVDFQNRYLPSSLLKPSFQKSRYLLSARNQWIVFAQWIVDLYNHMSKEKNTIINGFKSAGVTEAIQSSQDIVMQNPFSE